MSLVYRSRSLPIGKYHVVDRYEQLLKFTQPPRTTSTVLADYFLDRLAPGTQVTGSEGHPWKSQKRRTEDIGGPFYTSKTFWESVPGSQSFKWISSEDSNSRVTKFFTGPLFPVDPATVAFPTNLKSSDATLDAQGATAVARSSPTNSIADAATFLGELVKDGLPNLPGMHLWKEKIRLAADAGDEFLNVAFGWLPLVSDVKSHASAVRKADAVMRQYERDAGKMVRRRYYFPTVRTVDRQQILTAANPYSGTFGSGWSTYYGTGNVFRTVETVRKQWFSGGFTYHLPTGYDSRSGMARNAEEAKRVFGATLTPDTLWELTPWSWAIDWFSNAGDVIHNLSSWKTFGLVLRYGYVMETVTQRVTYSFERYPGSNPNNVNVPDLSLVTTTKQRRQANPFGFGVTWSALSPLQTAIAAALGLSRT